MRPPVPPFDEETARKKVQAAEDAWNTRDPERVAAAYTEDSQWRNRDEFLAGRPAVVEFLRRKWDRELDYALRKELWAFTEDRIAVRFQYECRDASGQWWRSYGNEQWEFDAEGYMRRREASINDVPIAEADRRIFGPRPEAEHGTPPPPEGENPPPPPCRRSSTSSPAAPTAPTPAATCARRARPSRSATPRPTTPGGPSSWSTRPGPALPRRSSAAPTSRSASRRATADTFGRRPVGRPGHLA